ncbi:PTS system cellobiose-specific IIB component [Bacillus oleivorans]|uniref:PTS system cellobiose-specific IIB component n=1 Tax=Bacillus oleivorans TaxID=1448271 RepID=A0A285D4K6_9BACI|nr:PTS sugar transporter subunit IIB [Bacillus oleivorans]SNX74709.1 PTS system cellobiose-specific IIB component [Bacillus oleivorans]
MKIILVCSAGMSTSMLVQRMRKAADEKGVSATIQATSEADLANHLDQTDVILVGPQVRYLAPKIKEKAAPHGIQVEVIDSLAYGMMDGGKVFEQAQGLVKSK